MLADKLAELAQDYEALGWWQGMQLGIQLGIQQGIQMGLHRLLIRKFGVIPADVLKKIAGATSEQIDTWLYQILDANSLDDMF